jgi:hypothetical protein
MTTELIAAGLNVAAAVIMLCAWVLVWRVWRTK